MKNSEYEKFLKFKSKLCKTMDNYLKKANKDFIEYNIDSEIVTSYSANNCHLYVIHSAAITKQMRKNQVECLKQINYGRNNDKWVTCTIICFLHEVLNTYNKCRSSDSIPIFIDQIQEISKRYNIPENSILSRKNIMVYNLEKSNNLNYYFSNIEIKQLKRIKIEPGLLKEIKKYKKENNNK